MSDEEATALNSFEEIGKGELVFTMEHFSEQNKISDEYPAIWHFKSYFPNNYLSLDELSINNKECREKLERFKHLINEETNTERAVLNFIRDEEAFFIIGSLVKDYADWGHHDLYLFPEFQIGTQYKADYLLVGKNSYGYHFMFIELENIYNQITVQEGNFGQTVRKGINQVIDWELWIEKNYNHLKPIFERVKTPDKQLPDEFYEYDKTRISYAVIAGRRKDYNQLTYRLRGKYWNESKIINLHYDNLFDLSEKVLDHKNY